MPHARPQTVKEQLSTQASLAKITKSLGNARATAALRKAVPAFKRGDFKAAALSAAEAAEADAKSASAFHLLALSLDNLGERHKAFEMYERALALDPTDPDLYLNIGTAATGLQLYDGAEKAFRAYIELRPDCPKGYNNLGGCLRDKGDIDGAIDVLRNAIHRLPQSPELWIMLGTVTGEMADFATAQTFYREALRLAPKSARAWHNLAYTINHTGPLDEALSYYNRALELCNDEADRIEMIHARGLCKIALGRLEEGWLEYEQRHNPRFGQSNLFAAHAQRWDGEDLAGKTLLLIGEQGLGDEIMFAGIIPDLLKHLGPAGRLMVACDYRLAPLLERSFPGVKCGLQAHIKHNAKNIRIAPWAQGEFKPDYYAPMGQPLPLLRKRIEDFPRQPFLKPDPARIDFWRQRLSALGPGPYVGMCWRSMLLTTQRRKFFSPIDAWRGPLSLPKIKFVNLQYGNCAADLAHARDKIGASIAGFEDLDLKNNLDDNAALCAALDLVISAPTAAAALAAGTGTETWFLTAGRVWPQLGTETYPWYANTRVLTPPTFGDWPVLMEMLSSELKRFASL